MQDALDRADGVLVEARDRVLDLRVGPKDRTCLRSCPQVPRGWRWSPGSTSRSWSKGALAALHPLVRDEISRLGDEAMITCCSTVRRSRSKSRSPIILENCACSSATTASASARGSSARRAKPTLRAARDAGACEAYRGRLRPLQPARRRNGDRTDCSGPRCLYQGGRLRPASPPAPLAVVRELTR